MEDTNLTDQEKAEKLKASKKAAAQKMMERKRAALDVLIALAERMGDDEEKKAAEYLKPGRHVGAASGPKAPKAKANLVDDIFADSDTAHEDDIYLQFKLGRTEMKRVIQAGVNAGVWITFDQSTGNYNVVARGEMPDGWLGPQPKAPKVL